MSLLLDALDRADKGRRDGSGSGQDGGVGAVAGQAAAGAMPDGPAEASPAVQPDGSRLTLEARPAEAAGGARLTGPGTGVRTGAAAAASTGTSGSGSPAEDVRALFELPALPQRPRRWLPWAALGVAVCAAASFGLWMVLALPTSGDGMPPPGAPALAGRPIATTALPAAKGAGEGHPVPLGNAAPAATVPPLAGHPAGSANASQRTDARHAADRSGGSRRAGDRSTGDRSTVASATAGATAVPSGAARAIAVPPADLRLFRRSSPTLPDPDLTAAWTALRDGHLAQAREAYLRLEQRLPDNADVQVGLASVAAEQGHTEEARVRYHRVLVLDPLNQTAQAGLAVLAPADPATAADSALRSSAVARDAGARYALAARLSAAGQWAEAEQAWFDALQAEPEQPDMLYNLAVALDHLGHAEAAASHYRAALAASQQRHARFERSAVEARLQALAGK